MDTTLRRAPEGAPAAGRRHARRIERQLERFPRGCRATVRGCAARDPALADLAFSFPALLAVIAAKSRGVDAEALARDVVAGLHLKNLALAAKLPFWTRKLPPEAFIASIGDLPAGDLVARRIGNHLPRKPKDAAFWLERVAFANRFGHEAFALWVARNYVALQSNDQPCWWDKDGLWQRQCVWAWFSIASETKGHQLIDRRWTPDISPGAAEAAARSWASNLSLHLCLDDKNIGDMWFMPGMVDGYEFVPLASARDIREEANAMANCLRTYGSEVICDQSRLWSVRKDGMRVATLSIGYANGDRLLGICEIRARANGAISREIAIAARKWCLSQDVFGLEPKGRDTCTHTFDRAHWQALFRPYWLAKRAIPDWLRLKPGCGPF